MWARERERGTRCGRSGDSTNAPLCSLFLGIYIIVSRKQSRVPRRRGEVQRNKRKQCSGKISQISNHNLQNCVCREYRRCGGNTYFHKNKNKKTKEISDNIYF
uniref:(northern house mosquito) hypothetical protein n=1 Tax=Culex pipiens TaxID=7175 RepID=A0A8D8CRJ9_CULPI